MNRTTLPPHIIDALTRKEQRRVRVQGTVHTKLWLRPKELRRCPSHSCKEYIAFRATCRSCSVPTVPLWET